MNRISVMRIGTSFILWSCIALLLSCGMPLGDRVDSENLSVYFEAGISKEEAITFSRFWQKNNFVGEAKQTIQLAPVSQQTVQVKLIENESYNEQPISIQEASLLSELKRQLEREVFGREVIIVITDNTFRPLERDF